MTVIAYKDGILAADTVSWQSETAVQHANKIKNVDPFCYACAGEQSQIMQFDAWAATGFDKNSDRRPVKNEENFGAIIVHRDGRVFRCSHTFSLWEVTGTAPFFVDGSCCDYLNGYLRAGGTAIEAVDSAITYCAWAGGTVCAVDTYTGEPVL